MMQDQPHQSSSLTRLSEGGYYQVASDDPDPRGWTVVSGDGTRVGEVKDLIVDPTALKVSYFEVELADRRDGDDRVLIDAQQADLSEHDRTVIVEASALAGAGLPSSRSIIADGRGRGAGNAVPDSGSEVERITRAEEELRIGKREHEKGEVVVRKTVEQEHVAQPVERRVERVRVERRPVRDGASREARIEGGEIRVPIVEEEVVVEKRPVVKEEIVIARDVETETEVVEADIRKERVDVEGAGNVERGGHDGRH